MDRPTKVMIAAILNSSMKELKKSLKEGADPKKPLDSGIFPLDIALDVGNPHIVKVLLESGADPNCAHTGHGEDCSCGLEPIAIRILQSTHKSKLEVLKLLLAKGLDLNVQDKFGASPLILSIELRSPELVELLLKSGADPNVRDSQGFTPYMYNALKLDHTREVIETILFRYGARKEGLDEIELVKAVEAGDLEKFQEFIGKVPENFVRHGELVQRAALRNRTEIIQALLAIGADPNETAKIGLMTPLMIAAYMGHVDSVKFLVENGADLHCRVEHGFALDAARGQRNWAVVDYLEQMQAPEIDPGDLRGWASPEEEVLGVFVKAPFDVVSESFTKLINGKREQNIEGREIITQRASYVVYQLKGHFWTAIQIIHVQTPEQDLKSKDAKTISDVLVTDALFWKSSLPGRYLSYDFYRAGKLLEYLELLNDSKETAVECSSELRDVRSQVPRLRAEHQIIDFVHDFLVSQNLWIPWWSDGHRWVSNPKQPVTLRDWPKGALVGMDHIYLE